MSYEHPMYTRMLAAVRMLEAARHNKLYQQMQQQQHHYKFNFALHCFVRNRPSC